MLTLFALFAGILHEDRFYGKASGYNNFPRKAGPEWSAGRVWQARQRRDEH